uniref:Uncharacterized protein n=1 Tax=Quercus lobata TaxID=97700 RepID=A0A7N2M3C8_QUELO
MYSLPASAFIAQEFTTQAALYVHHQYIAGWIMTGAFAHGAIFFIKDYNLEQNEDNVLARILDHKEAIISHLSWASLFLGFHTLGLYVHNDVMLAFDPGTVESKLFKARLIQGKSSAPLDLRLAAYLPTECCCCCWSRFSKAFSQEKLCQLLYQYQHKKKKKKLLSIITLVLCFGCGDKQVQIK